MIYLAWTIVGIALVILLLVLIWFCVQIYADIGWKLPAFLFGCGVTLWAGNVILTTYM